MFELDADKQSSCLGFDSYFLIPYPIWTSVVSPWKFCFAQHVGALSLCLTAREGRAGGAWSTGLHSGKELSDVSPAPTSQGHSENDENDEFSHSFLSKVVSWVPACAIHLRCQVPPWFPFAEVPSRQCFSLSHFPVPWALTEFLCHWREKPISVSPQAFLLSGTSAKQLHFL